MIAWLSKWAQGIIVAVIIATLIELILPNGSNKKYVKVVVGIYILFTIISPIFEKLNGNTNLNEILNIEKYEQELAENDNNISTKLEANNSRSIKDIYIENLKSDLVAKLKTQGYKVINSIIEVNDDENYAIKKITLKLDKIDNESNQSESEIKVNTIEIGNESTYKEGNQLDDGEKKDIKKYISTTYDINENNIEIT